MAAKKKVMDQPPAPRAGGALEAKGAAARAPETKAGAAPAAGGKGARSGTKPK